MHSNNELLKRCYIVCTGGTHVYHDTVVEKNRFRTNIIILPNKLTCFSNKVKYSIKIFI